MYECPNCGGNLKFDILSQKLKCAHCLTMKDPYEVTREKDAEESNVFEATIFTCPQCAGEILSTDTSAAEFCSFCGASTILDSRISRELRPARIIPFKQTKEACKSAFISHIKRSPFAPDDLKDEKHIESFRGIYMPYWSYDISQQGPVRLTAEKSYRRGNYLYTDRYALSGSINAQYHNLSYDASSSFADNISEQIAPFDTRMQIDFTPSFLSGFYADTADVDSSLYENDARALANNASYGEIKRVPAFSGLSFKNSGALDESLHTECPAAKRVMYPVWFMSYRKGDRIAYATVNGQTGKVAADIPVDIKKYVLASLIMAIPIFLFLNLFFTISPTITLICSIALAAATFFIYIFEVVKIYHRDKKDDDRGYLFRHTFHSSAESNHKDEKADTPSAKESGLLSGSKSNKAPIGFIGSLAAMIAAVIVCVWNPISDIWYYGSTSLIFLGILSTIIGIIRKYNILTTRKLPQFERKGGDDSAF